MQEPAPNITEKPVLFSGEMVRAILRGNKTQTRRVMKPQPNDGWWPASYGEVHKLVDGLPDPDKVIGWGPCDDEGLEAYASKYGRPGDRLWVRETFDEGIGHGHVIYRATCDDTHARNVEKWRPSIFMPRWASRLTLEVTEVRVERVQDISEDDILAEGIQNPIGDLPGFVSPVYYRECFERLWDSINAKRGHPWESNPWVWVVEFKRIKPE